MSFGSRGLEPGNELDPAKAASLTRLSDDELLAAARQTELPDAMFKYPGEDALGNGNHRMAELLQRAADPNAFITYDSSIYIYSDLVSSLSFRSSLGMRMKWPIVENRLGVPAQGIIKKASVQDILKISAEAKKRHWSATGRPSWLREHSEQIKEIFVTVLTEDRDYLRCSVVTVLSDGSGGHFSLDISPASFKGMGDLEYGEVVTLAHRYFIKFKSIPLDPEQQAAWDQWNERRQHMEGS